MCFIFLILAFILNLRFRWDFRLRANREIRNYWMFFRGMVDCNQNGNLVQTWVIVHYKGAAELGNWPKDPIPYLQKHSVQPNVRISSVVI